MRLKFCGLVATVFVASACTNIFSTFSDHETDAALLENARRMLDQRDYDDALAQFSQMSASYQIDRSVLALATEASLRAVDDAGLTTGDIDGVVSFFHNQDTIAPRQLVQALGLEDCSFQVMSALGGGWACAAVATAAMAVHAGLCRNVLVYRAMRGRSERTR